MVGVRRREARTTATTPMASLQPFTDGDAAPTGLDFGSLRWHLVAPIVAGAAIMPWRSEVGGARLRA
jgi:hypothetical protein